MRKSAICIFVAMLLIAIAASGCVDKKAQEEIKDINSMNVSVIAVRGGYPAEDSKTYQYQIELLIKNEGKSEIAFDTIGMYYLVNERMQPFAYSNAGLEKKWIVKPGETEKISTESADKVTEGIALARSRGLNTLVLAVIFFNNSRYVNGLYGTQLPLVEDLHHESEGVGTLLYLNLVVPGEGISEENMTEFYNILLLSGNRMGIAAEPTAEPRKTEPMPEIAKEQGFSEPTFAMIGFVKYQNYSTMYAGPEYSIELLIQSATNHPVTFNKIVAKYYDQKPKPNEKETNINPVTLNYGEAVRPIIETSYLQEMQNTVEDAGKKTIVIYIQLKNGEENVGGEYSASLPPLFYMENLGKSHRINFALDNAPLYR